LDQFDLIDGFHHSKKGQGSEHRPIDLGQSVGQSAIHKRKYVKCRIRIASWKTLGDYFVCCTQYLSCIYVFLF